MLTDVEPSASSAVGAVVASRLLKVMLRTRQELEEIAARVLAPYAMAPRASRGRRFPEPEHPMRTVFARDRDRIIHSAAFRRLEYKTQVFVNHEGDYYRTRLTHTLEAAQIARTAARALGLNEELAEAVALAHDLGHTPFGHAGEKILNELMAPYGGFDHNAQSLRTVDWIEIRYPNFRGLNLSFEVREGIIKHSHFQDRAAAQEFDPSSYPCLEAQIVDLADEIAYLAHDVDDGLKAQMLTVEELNASALFRESAAAARDGSPSAEMRVIRYQTVSRMTEKAGRVLAALFQTYMTEPRQMPEHVVARADRYGEPISRAVADYIAGMTDRFALDEYRKLFDPNERV